MRSVVEPNGCSNVLKQVKFAIMAYLRWLAVLVVCAAAATLIAKRVWSPSKTADSELTNADRLVRITPQRIPLAEEVAVLCISPSTRYGPHLGGAEVHIYSNERVLNYRREHPNEFDYPIGSKFVKEKYSNAGDTNPDVATIMERCGAKGDISDWTFSMVSLPAKTPLTPTGSVTCAACHERYQDTGYVSADSEEALRKYLKID
jgi:hypothetical protein